MRDRDRWWWLLVFTGIACGIAGIVVPYHLVTNEPTPAENQFVTDAEYRQWIGIDILLGLVLLGCAVTLITLAARAHTRHLKRLEAFAGAMDVIPLAEIRTEAAPTPDVAAQPLELMWRSSKVTSFFYIVLFIVQGLGLLLMAGLALVGLVLLLVERFRPMNIWEIAQYVAGILALVAILVGLIIAYVRILPFLFSRPFGVTATNAGIDERTELGARIHMDWDEAQLLEVVGADANAARRFYLYAPGKRIGWAEYMARFGADYVPAGISSSEMALRQNALLNLVVARTGLPPRTLARSSQKWLTSSGELKRSTSILLLMSGALALAGIAAADYLIPFSPIPWLTWVSTGALALVVLYAIFSAMRMTLTRSAPLVQATPPSAGVPTLEAPGLVYALSWRPPLGRRIALITLGLCFAINLVPGVLLFLLAIGVALPGYQPHMLTGDGGDFISIGRIGLIIFHVLAGMVGAGLVYSSTIAATVRISVDQRCLMTERGRRQQMIAWSNIQYILWGAWGGQFRYWVVSNVPTIWTSWPAGSQAANVGPPGDGAMPIGADELAALVAAQIGKPIRVREGS